MSIVAHTPAGASIALPLLLLGAYAQLVRRFLRDRREHLAWMRKHGWDCFDLADLWAREGATCWIQHERDLAMECFDHQVDNENRGAIWIARGCGV